MKGILGQRERATSEVAVAREKGDILCRRCNRIDRGGVKNGLQQRMPEHTEEFTPDLEARNESAFFSF